MSELPRAPFSTAVPDVADRIASPQHRLARGATFSGLLQLPGDGRIDGHVTGEVIVAGVLWIGPQGRVDARVDAPQIVVEGELHGEVAAADRIELRATARVSADLHTPKLVLEEGSFFEGQCSTDIPEPAHRAPRFASEASLDSGPKTRASSS